MTFGFDLADIIKSIGYVGLFAIVFAESGLFFGFFCPAIVCFSRRACSRRAR
jgi:membrane protein DedA with SNARE-associated domain